MTTALSKALAVALLVGACAGPQERPKPPVASEATLWHLCYDSEGDPIYYETPQKTYACKKPEVIDWGVLPISVHLDKSVLDASDRFLWAFKTWEDWLGTPVFVLTPEEGPGIVEVVQGEDILGMIMGAAAFAPHIKVDGVRSHAVIFFEEYRFDVEVIAHEFGHVLGLSHDKLNRRSIMYPSVGSVVPWLTHADRRALCALYGC